MQYWLLFIPFISALIGWIINSCIISLLFHPSQPKNILGLHFQGLIPAKQKKIAEQAGNYVSTHLFSSEQIKNKLTNSDNIEKLMPFVEAEVDHFLRKKLTDQMPMISMFIGEKTILQLKGIFTEEIKTLFPTLISNYIGNIEADLNIEAMITEKIESVSAGTIENLISTVLKRELQLFKLAGAVTGFLIGIIQLIITLLL